MDKLTEHTYTGHYDYNNELTITRISNNTVIATDFSKLIEEVNALHFQIKKLEDIQKWKNWRFR